ncbi:MAG: glycosyltransferase family 4 protein [Caldilineales bacterium]|nr:glycosyltransferase family 4 protein [Caldilineales bacterium]
MPTLLFAHSSDELYGSDIVLLELVRRLDPARFRPVVLTPTDLRYEGRLSRALTAAGLAHHAVDMPVLRRRYLSPTGLPGFWKRLLTGTRQVQRLAVAEEARLIHSNTAAVWGGALAARRLRLPHVWHIHELITEPVLVRRLVAGMVARYADRVVAISRAVADHLLADQPGLAARLTVIPDAVDTDRFHPQVDGVSLRRAWGVAADEVLVGVVGRISAWKGQEVFIEALAQARRQAPNLCGVIVGDVVPGEGWRRDELVRRAGERRLGDCLIWAGYREDVPQVMAALDVLVLPSVRPEPFGMVVLEAMATGKPVVATAHGGPLETVRDGETGYLVPPGRPEPLAAALAQLAQQPDLRRRLGQGGRERVCRHFTFANHVAAFAQLYAELLALPL